MTYRVGPLTTSVQARIVGAGNIDNLAIPGTSTSANIYRIGTHSFWNLSASYDFARADGTKIQLFGLVDNVFNAHPPFPFMVGTLQSSPYYTTLERTFRFGVRFSH